MINPDLIQLTIKKLHKEYVLIDEVDIEFEIKDILSRMARSGRGFSIDYAIAEFRHRVMRGTGRYIENNCHYEKRKRILF